MNNMNNMKNTKIAVDIKGTYSQKRNKYFYKDGLIVCKRTGSVVEAKNGSVHIYADVTGVDKVYFQIKKDKVIISNIFKDFLDNALNEEFMKFQKSKGYVPYPFTILKSVMKCPPGLTAKIYTDKNGMIKYSFKKNQALEIFDANKDFNKKHFRKEFSGLSHSNAKGQKELISSLSGGFDSLLLTHIYKDRCRQIIHFSENKKIGISRYKKIFPKTKWTILTNDENFSEADRNKYFKSIDEPSCDSAGFAEYLMIKKLNDENIGSNAAVMNGQLCDGIFANGRIYFQEFISSKMPKNIRDMMSKKDADSRLMAKIQNYSMQTKKRFMKNYLGQYKLSKETQDEIDRIYGIYENEIDNDSTNKLAACMITLRNSIHGIEKIRTAAHAFNTKYYVPFMSEDIIRYAFSIPAKHKVGYKTGKQVLIRSYPEISKMKFVTSGFLPDKLKERLIGNKVSEKKYNDYYTQKWIEYNKIRKIKQNKIK